MEVYLISKATSPFWIYLNNHSSLAIFPKQEPVKIDDTLIADNPIIEKLKKKQLLEVKPASEEMKKKDVEKNKKVHTSNHKK